MHTKRLTITYVALAAALLGLFALNLFWGSVAISPRGVVQALLGRGQDELAANILLQLRLPRAVMVVLLGAALSVAGYLLQTFFANPIAGPFVMGISSGAKLVVALTMVVFLNHGLLTNSLTLILAAFAGSMAAMAFVLSVARRVHRMSILVICGVMIGYIANAVIGVLKFFSAEEDIRAYVVWGLGSFARVSGGQTYVFVVMMLVLLPFSFLLIKTLNLMLLGDAYASNLGLNVKRARIEVITCAGVLCAVVTAYCGPIVFLGLAVPHICRGLFRSSDHRVLLPSSLLAGSSLALLCNLISRMPGFEGALPVNSVTALVGAPVVIYVLLHRHQRR